MSKYIFTDGQKSTILGPDRPGEWTWLSGGPDDGIENTAADYFNTVPWLYRGVGLRANAVASLPFDLIEDATGEIVMSDGEWVNDVTQKKDLRRGGDRQQTKWENEVGFMHNPYKMFWLLESSQVLSGRSYLFKVANDVLTFELKYNRPISIRPMLDEVDGLIGFERNTGQKTIKYPHSPDKPLTNKILYFWLDDPNVELGEPDAWPAKTALSASGVLFNVDEFLNAFIKRGMVKPTLIGLKGNPPAAERDKTEAWFNKYLAGIKNAFRVKTISADGVEVTTIGEGLKELGSTELTKEKRQDISTALGIPQTLLFSEGAGGLGGGGVVEQDDKRFQLTTNIPAFKGHADNLNRQLLIPMGYRIIERHERMEIFQEDKKDSSAAMVNLTSAVATDPKAAKFSTIVLGMEIPEEAEKLLEEMISQKEEDRENMAEMQANAQAQQPAGNGAKPPAAELSPKKDPEEKRAMIDDLGKWQRKAKKALDRGKEAACPFDSENIPDKVNDDILSMLVEAKTAADITAIFEAVKDEQTADYGDFSDLVNALGEATRALREKGTEDVQEN